MKQKTLYFILLLWACAGNAQVKQPFNLGFEKVSKGFPDDWGTFSDGTYTYGIDSTTVKSGKYAVCITFNGDKAGFASWAFTLPDNYKGNNITLNGYLKTENVSDGFAGLWMRIDPEIAFDNMGRKGVKGTTDWAEYGITLKMNPEKTRKIVFGVILDGKGKVWADDLKITIDGKDISQAKIHVRTILPAENDTAFDHGSNITFPQLTEPIINNLELLGKLWGFLKYHHPAIAKGKYNWDYELFRLLPAYLGAADKKQRDQLLLNWINQLGEVTEVKKGSETSGNAFLKPNLDWIDKSDVSKELKNKVKMLYRDRNRGTSYYIAMESWVGNPKFTNENQYASMNYPDPGFRLLTLYRYWNMIRYFYPYRYLSDTDWELVLKKYIPVFINAGNELEFELATLRLIGEVSDTHANLWVGGDILQKHRGDHYAPFRVEFVENKLVVTDYYNPEMQPAAIVRVGDIITKINGKTVGEITDSLKPYYPASNEAARLRDIAFDMLRSASPSLHISYLSGSETRETRLTLYSKDSLHMYGWYREDSSKCYKLLNDSIAYITLQTIKKADIPGIREMIKNRKGVIIDMRNYPSEYVPFILGTCFCRENTPYAKCTRGNVSNPGEFTFVPPVVIPKSKDYYPGKVMILVNEYSQSQAEWTAMALRATGNAMVIGSTTAGADGNVSMIILPGGMKTYISGIGVYYPDGGETQREGIVPDVYIRPTVEGIREGRDEVLQKAMEIISKSE